MKTSTETTDQRPTDLQPTYVRLPRELHDAVQDRARQDERSMAQTIRQALKYYLANTTPQVQG